MQLKIKMKIKIKKQQTKTKIKNLIKQNTIILNIMPLQIQKQLTNHKHKIKTKMLMINNKTLHKTKTVNIIKISKVNKTINTTKTNKRNKHNNIIKVAKHIQYMVKKTYIELQSNTMVKVHQKMLKKLNVQMV